MARLDELERKFEENPRRYFAPLANEYRKAGDAERAAELCRSQLPEVPGHISGHIVLGQALFDSGDFAGSRSALETALALDPENIVALRYLGDIARSTGDTVEAERWYSRTLEADPYNEAAMLALQALRESADTTEAREEPAAERDMDAVAEAESATTPFSPADGFEPTSYEPMPEAGYAAQDAPEASSPPLAATEAPDGEQEPTLVELSVEAEPPVTDEAPGSVEFAGDLEISAQSEPVESLEAPEISRVSGVSEDVSVPVAPHEATSDDVPSVEVAPTGVAAIDATPVEIAPAEVASVDAATEPAPAETSFSEVPAAAADTTEVSSSEAQVSEVAATEVASGEAADSAVQATGVAATEGAVDQPVAAEGFDVAAHASAELPPVEESIQAEEQVMESAAPFVTETMADLYMEQGYPHEALELLLQLSEQRPQDEQLRAKIESIESVIVARRDAAVAAARAERAEMSVAADRGGDVAAESHVHTDSTESAAPAEPAAPVEFPEPGTAPFDAAVAEVDSPAFAETPRSDTPVSFGIPPLEPASEAPISVRELFARMDRVRPRPASTVTPRPLSRIRSDFVPMPESGARTASMDDPFAFPDAAARAEERPGPVPRSSGPQPTFNPSTADSEDFNAWLRGLKGP